VITIFHVFEGLGLVAGASLGYAAGSRAGVTPGIIAAIVGGVVGLRVGGIPWRMSLRSAIREFRLKSADELRAMLHAEPCPTPNLVLLELQFRGQDIECELPLLARMLGSESLETRSRAWHALASAFPERARLLMDYSVTDHPEVCRLKAERLGVIPAA
jgi:hypothetical protein